MKDKIISYLDEASQIIESTKLLHKEIAEAASLMIKSLENNGTIFWCGNGGSAADSQHLATELVGKFMLNRPALRSIALTTDTSILTAVANDIDYSQVFSRQLSGLGRAGDVLIGISTSGKSQSVLEAIKLAETMKIKTIFLTGQNTPNLKSSLDCIIQIPSETTSHIQEGHITVGQLLCGLVENHFYG